MFWFWVKRHQHFAVTRKKHKKTTIKRRLILQNAENFFRIIWNGAKIWTPRTTDTVLMFFVKGRSLHFIILIKKFTKHDLS